jgi:broad specificity phosphatase PhoE
VARKIERRRAPPDLKRRGSKSGPIAGFIVVCLGLAWFFELQATTTLVFVRHTDTIGMLPETSDPGLSQAGLQRAELLADFVQNIDVVAGVDAIYASDNQRTQQTAAPLAERLGLEIRLEDPYAVEPFMAEVLDEHKGEIVLVVTHSDIIAPLVEELHGSKNIPVIEPDEYGNIYIVTIPWFGKVKTLRLPYDLSFRPRNETFSDRRSNQL